MLIFSQQVVAGADLQQFCKDSEGQLQAVHPASLSEGLLYDQQRRTDSFRHLDPVQFLLVLVADELLFHLLRIILCTQTL